MDHDAQCNVNLLMILALHWLLCSTITWARLKLLCGGRKHTGVCLTGYVFILCPFLYICCISIDLICWALLCYCFNHYFFSNYLRNITCSYNSLQVLGLFSHMQLSVHDKLVQKNVFHGIAVSTTMLLLCKTTDNIVREKIPFLWFVGNISVLKFCGCPAETGAKISFILLRWLNIFLNNLRQNDTRDDNREEGEK